MPDAVPAAFPDQLAVRRAATEIACATLLASRAETAAHCDDVDVIAEGICRQLGIDGEEREDVIAAARLHDIGKVAMPPEILEKGEPLDEDEWTVVRRHTVVGEGIVGAVPELANVARLIRHSHERWDGRGYPDGLAGEAIPLGSRIVFCADAFHAIRSDRPYSPGRSARAALREIEAGAGTQFDPEVVDGLSALAVETRLVAQQRHRTRRSSRLVALLMILACGAGGSALARSGVLGEPQPAPAPAPVAGPEAPAGPGEAAAAAGFAPAPFLPVSCDGDGCRAPLLGLPLAAFAAGPERGAPAPPPREASEPPRRHQPAASPAHEGAAAESEPAGGPTADPVSAGKGDAGAKGSADSGKAGATSDSLKGSAPEPAPVTASAGAGSTSGSGGKTAPAGKTAPDSSAPVVTADSVAPVASPTAAPAPDGGKAPAPAKGEG